MAETDNGRPRMRTTTATVDAASWRAAARRHARDGTPLVALWGADRRDSRGEGFAVYAAYAAQEALECLCLPIIGGPFEYPDLSSLFPCANRMQRAVFDLLGLRAHGADDVRPWLRHSWPEDFFPLRHDSDPARQFEITQEQYPFVTVRGDGVHEIAVGPIHAGIIEPGHFRFSIVGEKVLRLEERLGYVHKGIEARMRGMAVGAACQLAGRVSGDSTVAFAWACATAAETATGCTPPPRALWLRALMLERERVANHLGDLGALGNDVALGFGLAQFSRLRELWQRASAAAFGHRMMMDRVVPGGVVADVGEDALQQMARQCKEFEAEVTRMRGIYDEHAGLQDRFQRTGIVPTELARRLGLCGLAARASGIARDLRVDHAFAPYDELAVSIAIATTGDVAGRAAVRFDETVESLRLIRTIVDRLPAGDTRCELPIGKEGFGLGWIEGWRGEVLVALDIDARGCVRRCHCHDPSWQNWPVLEHAVIGNIVPDFPLINKSFNLSYSGQDL